MAGENEAAAAAGDISVETKALADGGEDVDEGGDGGDGGDCGDVEGLGSALPAARVKRIMRKNPDKKKNFSKETVLAVSMATELFLEDMVKTSHMHTVQKKRKTMQLTDIADSVKQEARYEFVDGPGILPMIGKIDPHSRAGGQGTAPKDKQAAVGDANHSQGEPVAEDTSLTTSEVVSKGPSDGAVQASVEPDVAEKSINDGAPAADQQPSSKPETVP